MPYRLRSEFIVVLVGLVVLGTSGGLAVGQRVGGPSTDAKYPGTATIVRVEKTKLSEQDKGEAKEGYEVWFTFKPSTKVKETLGRKYLADHKEHEFRLTNSWYPGPEYLKKYGLEKGKQFGATLNVITSGTSTPVILELDGVDRSDYFEAAPRAAK